MLVQLDRNHFPGGSCQITRQASEARTNFQHSVRWPNLSRCDDLLEGDWILQKILSKTLVRAQAISLKQVARVERGNFINGQKGIPSSFVLVFSGVAPAIGQVP